MLKNQTTIVKKIASIGEEISHELGTKFIEDYQLSNPFDTHYYVIGRNIIDRILAQPGCTGIRFYNAYNESGEKTLVYVGLNYEGEAIVEYTSINSEGVLESDKGIVADRIRTGGRHELDLEIDGWGWLLD